MLTEALLQECRYDSYEELRQYAKKDKGKKRMARRVGIGIPDLAEVRKGDYFYMDKTSLIKEWMV